MREPLFPVPVTVTVYVPDLIVLGTVIFSVDVPELVIDLGLRLAVSPLGAVEES
jgi:hypothetical protein